MVDEIAGIKSINSSVFCIWKYLIKLWKVHARFISCFLTSKQKHTLGDKGCKFLSYVLIM